MDKREGFSSSQEERANVTAVEREKEADDSIYKKEIDAANREFNRAKKRRDDITAKFQATSIDFEDQQKNINAVKLKDVKELAKIKNYSFLALVPE